MTYIEVVVSMMILSTAVAAGLQAFGSFALGQRCWEERSKAIELANQLMAEISLLPFADPSVSDPYASHTIGIESGETAINRSTFDDVDDYNGWDSVPPRDRTNAQMTAFASYEQKVSVVFDTSLRTKTGLTAISQYSCKRITVTISKNGKELVTLVTIRAAHDADK